MTRISTLLVLLPLFIAVCWSGDETVSPARTPSVPHEQVEDLDGVEAEYAICFSIPYMQQSAVMHVRYLVTPKEWAAVVGADVGFSQSPITPHIATAIIHCTKERVELYSPWEGYRHVHTRQPQRTKDQLEYENQTYGPMDMVSRLDETDAWRLPGNVISNVLESPQLTEQELAYQTEKNSDLSPKLNITRREGAIQVISQTLAPGWTRLHSAFKTVGELQVATLCDMNDMNSRFAKFFEWTLEFPGTHPRNQESGLQFHNGGRRVELEWRDLAGAVLPAFIKVKLGHSKDGMFLRSCQLVRSRRVSSKWIRKEIDASFQRKKSDLTTTNISLQVGQYYWGKTPADLTEVTRSAASQFHVAFSNLQKSQGLDEGDQVSILRDLVILTAASDETKDHAKFREAVKNYSEKIMQNAGIDGLTVMMFDMVDMLRSSKQEELIDIAFLQFRTHLDAQAPEQQFSTLMGIMGPSEIREFCVFCMLDVIAAMANEPQPPDPSRIKIRAGLIVAENRVEYSLRNHLSKGSTVIHDPTRRQQQSHKIVSEYLRVLKLVEASEDELLKDTAQVLRNKFSAMDFNEP